MSDTLDTTNLGFRMIQDSMLDAKVFESLVKAGILPQGFQVIKATVDLTDVAVGSAAVLDARTGLQVQLATGQHIILATGVTTDEVTSGGAATVNVGLSATADGTVATSLSTGALALAAMSLGDTFTNAANTALVAANRFLVAQVAVATITTGVIEVVLIIA